MSNAAADMAKANAEKEQLADELLKVHLEIKQLEKRKGFLKDKLAPLMQEGERVGMVSKDVKQNLNVDAALLSELEERFGPSIVKRSVNTPVLRQHMKEDTTLDERIPRKKSVVMRVGEEWKG
jgi:hypothetical protein